MLRAAHLSSKVSPSGWRRLTVPLLSPSVSWEGTSLQEPNILYESGTWKMWYTGAFSGQGLGGPATGYATCTGDPTVTGNWTKYASNPVLGQGTVVSGFVSGINVCKVSSTYYAYYYDGTSTQGGNLKVSTSSDGITWNTPTTGLSSGGTDGYANTFVWNEGGTAWNMIVEQYNTGANNWVLKYATSTDGLSWSVSTALTSLAVNGYPGYSGPWLANGGQKDALGRYQLWYHINQVNNSQIWRAYSAANDPTSWTPRDRAELYASGSQYEVQQAADPCVIDAAVSGRSDSLLFYDGVDNPGQHAYINVASYPGTLSALLASG